MDSATLERPWLSAYPAGVPADVDVARYASLVELMEESFQANASKAAYSFMGRQVSYRHTDRCSVALGAYLQRLGLRKGDRVAVMLPNVPQYPMAVAAILRAGLVVVNVNPLYTPRELQHQLKDSGATAIFILENFAHVLQRCLPDTAVQHIVLCAMGDELGWLKGALVNFAVRLVKKMVPVFSLPKAVGYRKALAIGSRDRLARPEVQPDDIAVLQYTGGTTGVARGAVLLHRNLVANVLQSEAWNRPAMGQLPDGVQPVFVCALPLYHIFAFTLNLLLGMKTGAQNILIPNPRDTPAVLRELSRHKVHCFPAVNTLFNSLASHPDFETVDCTQLLVSIGGGMAVTSAVAKLWLDKTGCPICEGYGLSEASPSASCNPTDSKLFTGTIGVPIPGTWFKLIDDNEREVKPGEAGELAIKGPQVMAGYWRQPNETARTMTPDGFLRSGDIAVQLANGYFKIVDRKKDMILVNGFNVFPNEVEEVVASLEGVMECACVGVADQKSGEAVKLIVVRKHPELTEVQLRDHCKAHLTAYKQPRVIEFRDELPKSPVGKILRRELREASAAKA